MVYGSEMLKPIPDLRLVGLEQKPGGSIVHVGDVAIGGRKVVMMAGPCSVESADQLLAAAWAVKGAGAVILRGGAYKPRTSPYSFRGLKEEGLRILADVRRETGLPVVTEAMDARHLEAVCAHADMIQIGSRNMQNYTLLEEVGRLRVPVLLKRGLSATIEEFLCAAEYVASGGNVSIVLCERGIRTFETSTRNTLDLSAVPVLKELTHLPVIVDPSHATGKVSLIPPLSLASVAAGADGITVEVHINPEEALCDKEQALTPQQFSEMMQRIRALHQFMDSMNSMEAQQ